MPELSVARCGRDTDRKLVLQHQIYNGKVMVEDQAKQTLKHLRRLWGF